MSECKKIKIKISYEIECALDENIYWKGATEEEMIKAEIYSANSDPSIYLDIGLENKTYTVEVEELLKNTPLLTEEPVQAVADANKEINKQNAHFEPPTTKNGSN